MSHQGTLDELLDALKSVDVYKMKIFRATSPAEMSAAQAGLARVTHEIGQKFPTIDKDLYTTFRTSFAEAGGIGTPDKNFRDKSYNARQKASKGFQRAGTGLRQWGNDFGRDRSIIKAREEYKKRIKAYERAGDQANAAKTREALKALPEAKGVSDNPSIAYNRRKNKKLGLEHRYVPADTYMKMATNTAYATQRNLGVTAAAAQSSGFVIVEDGPNCGMRGHHDGPAVNGQVWPIDLAFSNPISHPSCQRTFRVSPGPPKGKKTQDLLRELGLRPQRSDGLNTLEAIARAASGAGVAATVGNTIIQNPFIRRFMRDLIADSDINLSPIAQSALNRLQTYGKREARAFLEHGEAMGAPTQAAFDKQIMDSFDNDLANEKFLTMDSSESVRISVPQAKVLGLSPRTTKGQLLEKLDDYGDYLVHKEHMAKTIEERIQLAANDQHALDDIYRTAAIKFHLEPGAGINAQRNWYNIINRLKKTYAANPDKADRELIRLAAGVFDPTPWLHATLAPDVKFTLGLTSRGRQNLAVKLFDIMKSGRSLTAKEAQWAEELGMDLTSFTKAESITKRDIINALTPRVTYNPGGLFSGTLALKNGSLQPIIRMYPHGTLGRLTSLETKLRAGSVEDFIKEMRKSDLPMAERWVNGLRNVAEEDLITSIHLFRNSPLQLSLRMLGQYPDSWAIRAMPDNDFLRYSYRFTLDARGRTALQSQVRSRLLNGEDVQGIINDIAKGATSPGEQKSARQLVARESALIAKANMDQWMEGIQVLPGYFGGFSLHGVNISQREAIIKLKLLGGNLLSIAKRTHYGYDQLLELWSEFRISVEDIAQNIGEKKISQIRSFKDATEVLSDSLRQRTSIMHNFAGADLKAVDLSFVDDNALRNPALRDDLARFRLAWEDRFPDVPIPHVSVLPVGAMDTPLMAEPGLILIRADSVDDWELLTQLRRKAVRVGHFPRDTEDMVSTLIHESSHTILQQMSPEAYTRVLRAGLRSQGWPTSLKKFDLIDRPLFSKYLRENERLQKRVARTVSGYAVNSTDELLSEALSEYFTSSNPRPFAKAVGEAFEKELTLPGTSPRPVRYKWLNLPDDEVKKIYNRKVSDWLDTVEREQAIVDANPPTKPHAQQWWFFEDDPDLEDVVEVERTVLANRAQAEDIQNGVREIHKLFPRLKIPRIGYHQTLESSSEFAPVNGAGMFYSIQNNQIFVPQITLEHYSESKELRALGERIGWTPKGTQDSMFTVIHEIGHSIMHRLDADQFSSVVDEIIKSDFINRDTKRVLRAFMDAPANDGFNWESELTNVISNDTTIRDQISLYGSSNFNEFFAEMFTKGVADILMGNLTSGPAKIVHLLQGMGLEF